ncbi:unnamed protein product [Closterium sp. NIES-64]|nr:unnamed protein product [Closterium sp. NIES-64]CAI6007378.1 unnamed protein product [Closterium sp. NIES-65]
MGASAAASVVVPAELRLGTVVLAGSLVPTLSLPTLTPPFSVRHPRSDGSKCGYQRRGISGPASGHGGARGLARSGLLPSRFVSTLLRLTSMFMLAAMGASPAASVVVPAELRVGTVVVGGSLVKPKPIYFFDRCMIIPEIALVASGGGKADLLVWWDVFGDYTTCDAVQLFASFDCSGTPAAEYQNTAYMSPITTDPSVKSIRCVLDNICSRATCPEHSTCVKTNDRQEVGCQCDQGYYDVYGQCQPM